MKRRKSAGATPLPGKPFGQVGADRLARPADLIRQRPLLGSGEVEAASVDSQEIAIRPLEHLEVF